MAQVSSEPPKTLSDVQFRMLFSLMNPKTKKASLVNFTHYYNGEKQKEVLEAFLSALNVYKQLENIDDKDVLSGMPILLKGEAAIWWQRVKDNVETWTEFETQIREAFVPNKPAYALYQEIMSEAQQPEEKIDIFVAKKQLLFGQLPSPGLLESQQLDMIYGLILPDIRGNIPRSSFENFKELLEAARTVERNLLNQTNLSHSPKHRTGKLRCSVCRTKMIKKPKNMRDKVEIQNDSIPSPAEIEAPSTSAQPKLKCYGCGAPGLTRSNCPACKGNPNTPRNKNTSTQFVSQRQTDWSFMGL